MIGEGFGGGAVLSEAKNETVRAIVLGRAEQAGDYHARRNRAADLGLGADGARKVDVVHDETSGSRSSDESLYQSARVARRNLQGGA